MFVHIHVTDYNLFSTLEILNTQCSVLSLDNTGLYELQNICVKPTLLPVCSLSSYVERQGDFPLSLLNNGAVSA